jgi:sulfonate transport system substrate-binding protein
LLHTRHRVRILGLSGALILAGTFVAACGGSSASSSGKSNTSSQAAATAASVPTSVPPGTTLRVADQLGSLELLLSASGENTGFPYAVKYSQFLGGPPMLQAFQAGAVDIGIVADTPLIFAQAAKQNVVGVAAWAPQTGTLALVSAPGQHLTGWSSLKGKKVAYQQGTVLEAALLQGLNSAGLSLKDITPVNLPSTSITPALENGSVAAAILEQPLTGAYLAKAPGAAQVVTENDITDRVSFIIADRSALNNPAKEAAIADYIVRLQKAYAWVNSHPTQWAEAEYVKQYKLPLAEGVRLVEAGGPVSSVPLPGTLVTAQQSLADLYQAAGEIPTKLNVASEFDSRFNSLLQETP